MFKNNFTSGELNPDLWGRSDLAQFANGCALARNFIPKVAGPLRRRAGFYLNGLPKNNNSVTILIPYVRAIDDAYAVELGNGYARFWQVDGTQVMDPGNPALPYEVAAPFSSADMAGLRPKQVGNTILFFHKDGRHPSRLQKVSEQSWNFAFYNFEDGPWAPENTNQGVTISADDWRKGEVVTLTASSPIFNDDMVGTFFKLRAASGLPGLRTWAADEDVKGFALRISNGLVYYATDAVSTEKTGNTPPSHDTGTVNDGKLDWTYLHDNSGVVQIQGFGSTTTVTAVVVRNLPTVGQYDAGDKEWAFPSNPSGSGLAFPATFAWSEALYSDYRGWPTAWPEVREERLFVAGGAPAPDKYNASQTAGYSAGSATFTPGRGTGLVLDDDAIQGFAGDDSFKVLWLISGPMLVCGTHGGEGVLVGDTGEAPLTPASTKPRALTRYGSAEVRPLKAQDSILFVARGAKSLRDLMVSSYDYPGSGSDLSFTAQHLADRKFVEIVYAAAPDYLVWSRMADGSLLSMVYNREQQVKGWSRHSLGGGLVVESLCVLPDILGNDRLWVVARRTKNAAVQRVILMMSEPNDRMRLDLAERYYSTETAVNAVTGLDHLNGEAVAVMVGEGNGTFAQVDGLTVTANAVTLPMGMTAKEIIVGLPYTSRFESLPMTQNSAQGTPMKPVNAAISYEGVRIRAGVIEGGLPDEVDARPFAETLALVAKHQVEPLTFDADHGLNPRIYIEEAGGFDLIIKSYNVEFDK